MTARSPDRRGPWLADATTWLLLVSVVASAVATVQAPMMATSLAVAAATAALTVHLGTGHRRAEMGFGAPDSVVTRALDRGRIDIVFQPIVALDTGAIAGVEALARFPDHRPPDHWFAEAERCGLGNRLELLAVACALETWSAQPGPLYVSVNVSPRVLSDPALLELLLATTLPFGNVVVEVTEHTSIDDYEPVLAGIARLRAAGARIAVDDAGSGFSSFRHVLRLRPDIIKLDRTLVTGIHRDTARRTLAEAVISLARQLSAAVVAEGVETEEDLVAVTAIGADAAQGWHVGRASDDPRQWRHWARHPSAFDQ